MNLSNEELYRMIPRSDSSWRNASVKFVRNLPAGTVITPSIVIFLVPNPFILAPILRSNSPKLITSGSIAEFSRIVPSFKHITKCWDSNINGTYNVIQYCIKNNSRLIYSGSSSKFGKIDNEHLSPYSWTKSKNIELIKNFSHRFKLNYTIVYF